MAPTLASLALVLLAVASHVVASPVDISKRAYAVKSYHATPRKWRMVSDAPSEHVLKLQFGLKQARMGELLQHLDEVSDPRHERYGQHLSADEVNRLVQPSDETLNLVLSWLADSGIERERISLCPAKNWVTVDVPVHEANALLNTKYSVFEHVEEGAQLIRTPEWSLPAHLHEHVDVVEPTNSFLRPVQRTPRSTVRFGSSFSADPGSNTHPLRVPAADGENKDGPTQCDGKFVTPGCLRSLYGTLGYKPKATEQNSISIANYLGELNNRADLRSYLKDFRPEAIGAEEKFPLISIANGTVAQNFTEADLMASTGGEGGLDIQTVIGIAWPTKVISYSTGGVQPGFTPDKFTPVNTNEPYHAWLEYMLALKDSDLPKVVSTSYADSEQTVSPEYAKRVCEDFGKLGARGVSLLFGSGDEGVGNNLDCVSNKPPNARTFVPEFPNTCPYITSVGGTARFAPEVAAFDPRTGFASGGGFSYYFKAPEYQKTTVAAYLKANNDFPAYKGWFDPTGRAYPDIAAQGVNYTIVYNGNLITVDGTSASTPTVAAIIALVNDALLATGRPAMGFLNPWIYQNGPATLNDVVAGSSAGCEGPGFPAAVGWDAVTGFGTPNFQKILASLGLGAAAPPAPRVVQAPLPLLVVPDPAQSLGGKGGPPAAGPLGPPGFHGPTTPEGVVPANLSLAGAGPAAKPPTAAPAVASLE